MHSYRKAVLFMIVLITSTFAVPAIGQPERGVEVGGRIEPREMRTIERERVKVPREEGLTVVLFWSTWSPRSEPALKLWETFAQEYGDHGIDVLAINADHQQMKAEDLEKIREYLAQKGVGLPVIVDSDLELYNDIGIMVLPTVLFLTPDGTLDYKYAGFPSSAEMDLKDDLEAKLGIAKEPSPEEGSGKTVLEYQPRNNALLFFNMGNRLNEKGFPEKAKAKYLEALQRDMEYVDPLRALEGLFFEKGRNPEAEERLKNLLTASGLEAVIPGISAEGEGQPVEAEPSQASATTSGDKKLTPMERMRLLMEKKQ